jgi:hypothetical protein
MRKAISKIKQWGLLLLVMGKMNGKLMAQQTPNNATNVHPYLEGARLVIDVLQLFKKNNRTKSETRYPGGEGICNYCLYNSDSNQSIKVVLLSKNPDTRDTITMVIPPKNMECSLQINCGVYNCRIESMDQKVISWGDILINEKEAKLWK